MNSKSKEAKDKAYQKRLKNDDAEQWSIGVLEYWTIEQRKSHGFPLHFHYSKTPVLQLLFANCLTLSRGNSSRAAQAFPF
jgi:hypothetical protein